MNQPRRPRPPVGLRAGGRRFWDSATDSFEGFEEHELALLREAARTVDLLNALDADIRRDGTLQETPQGVRAHPSVVEARQQRIALARLLGALRMPVGDDEDSPKPQRRVGVRTPYAMGGQS